MKREERRGRREIKREEGKTSHCAREGIIPSMPYRTVSFIAATYDFF